MRNMRLRRLLFIVPPLSAKERYGKLASGSTDMPMLGFLTLSSIAKGLGYEVSLLDCPTLNYDNGDILSHINKYKPQIVLVTSTTVAISNAGRMLEIIKQNYPEILTVLGGVHITCLPVQTMRNLRAIDIGVIGEGEDTLPELLEAVKSQEALDLIKGIIFRRNTETVTTAPRPFFRNLDSLPYPSWEMLPSLISNYSPSPHTIKRLPSVSLVTSRGCPGQCKFCYNYAGNKIRGFSAKYVIEQIKYLISTYGIKEIFFMDDNFLVLRKRLREICEQIITDKIDLTWSCVGRVDGINPEILELMHRAGCWQIGYGIESGSNEILGILKKQVTIEQIDNALSMTRKAGIQSKGFFMIGNPGESLETMEQTVRFLKRANLDALHTTFYTPFPGSPFYEEIEKWGTYTENWENLNMWSPVFIPNGLTEEQLVRFHKKYFSSFYFRPRTIFNYGMKLANPLISKDILKGTITLIKYRFSSA